MPIFQIPVRWEMAGIATVEAETLEQAEISVYTQIPIKNIPAEYVAGSFEVDEETIESNRLFDELAKQEAEQAQLEADKASKNGVGESD
jgi:hypothetical protein